MLRPTLPCATLMLLAACASASQDSSLTAATIDTLPNGVVQVTNTGPTAWADTSGWRLVLEREIVPDEGTPGEFGNPYGLDVGSDGSIFVLQASPATIKVFGADGEWQRDIGREGDGPGEFRSGMFGVVRDTLFVQDPSNSRFTTFTAAGAFVATTPSHCCWSTPRFPIFEDGTVGIPGSMPEGDGGAHFMTRMNGTVTDTIPFPAESSDPKGTWSVVLKRGNNTSVIGMSIPLAPTTESAWFPIPQRVVGRTAEYSLAIVTTDDDTLRRFSASAPTVTISETQRDSIYDAVIAGTGEEWRDVVREVAKKSEIPTTWPAWSGVIVDRASRIWIGRAGAKGGVTTLDVFTPEGVLLGAVPSPSPHILKGVWTNDRVYLRDETDEGMSRIRVFRIDTLARVKS